MKRTKILAVCVDKHCCLPDKWVIKYLYLTYGKKGRLTWQMLHGTMKYDSEKTAYQFAEAYATVNKRVILHGIKRGMELSSSIRRQLYQAGVNLRAKKHWKEA